MRIEIREAPPTCDECGAGRLLRVPGFGELEQDLFELFADDGVPWWRPIRRRRHAYFRGRITEAAERLRGQTRFV